MKHIRVTAVKRVFVLLLSLHAWLPAPAQKRVVSARAGLVTRAEGEVLYHCHEKGEGVEQLRAGVQLHDGDRVFTSAGGSVTWALNPGSYMTVSPDSAVRVYDGSLGAMHFDVERGEAVVVVRSLKNGAALVIHAPPGILAVHKAGRYLFRVEDDGETEAAVGGGELRYLEKGKEVSLKKGRKVSFRRTGKGVEHER
jgi:hypothetical protein